MKKFIKGFMASNIIWLIFYTYECTKISIELKKELNESNKQNIELKKELECLKSKKPHGPYPYYKKYGRGPNVCEDVPKNPIGFC